MRQVLSREGLPALYDLYAGSCRLLAQRPLPLITELPPPLDAYTLRAALHVAQRRRVTASRRDLATDLTCSRPTDLTVCPRCGCSPTGCAAAHPESVANIRHQLHVVMKQSITQGESVLGVRAFPASEESLLAWRCAGRGPAGSPWAGKAVPFLLRFCGPWPNAPPLLVALPPIPFHPNFDSSTGAVCMDLLQEHWSPAAGVLGVLLSAQSLLTSPTVADANSLPANVEAAHQLLRKPAAYHSCNQRLAASLQPW
jgi:ubiquitin-protein ligase